MLATAALAATEEFVARATDPGNFGLANAMTAAMLADDVDLSDQQAVDGWIAAYNALPEEERHRRVPAFARPGFLAPPSSSPQAKPAAGRRKTRTKVRKTQRQARRRNRR